MIIRYTVTVVILFITGFIWGQVTYQDYFENPPLSVSQQPQDVIETAKGQTFVVLSTGILSVKNVRLARLNTFGEIQLDTTYDFTPSGEFFPRIINAHDGGVIVASTSFSYPVDDQDGEQDILVWKINEVGEIIWQKVIAARMFNSIIATSDGNYILLGVCYTETIDLQMTKIDGNGEIIWQKIMERPWDGELISWESASSLTEIDGAIYVGADIGSPEEIGSDGSLYKFDLNGELIWELRAPRHFPENDIHISSVFKFNNQFYFKDNKYDGELYWFNPQTGDFRNINDSIQLNVLDMVIDTACYSSDIITGVVELTEKEFNFRKYDRLDSAAYYDIPFDAPEGGVKKIIKSRDGGYIVLSSTWSEGTVVVSKTDCLGNVTYWSEDCNPKRPVGQDVFVYPNPVQNELIIEAAFDFNKVTIINSAGQDITYKNECNCNRKTIDVSTIAAGVYLLKIEGETEIAFEKFVKI